MFSCIFLINVSSYICTFSYMPDTYYLMTGDTLNTYSIEVLSLATKTTCKNLILIFIVNISWKQQQNVCVAAKGKKISMNLQSTWIKSPLNLCMHCLFLVNFNHFLNFIHLTGWWAGDVKGYRKKLKFFP